MASNQNVTQLTQQTGSANPTSLFYAVTDGTTDTGLPFSVFVNNLGLTGVPTAPTATNGTNTTQIASCAFVQAQTAALYAPLLNPTFTGTVTIPVMACNGGNINNTAIGATTPSVGHFSTVTANGGTAFNATTTGAALWSGSGSAFLQLNDSTRTSNNRIVDTLWSSGTLQYRFVNDAYGAAISWLSVSGGYANGITGMTSNSGTGSWVHTGGLTVSGAVTFSQLTTDSFVYAGTSGNLVSTAAATNGQILIGSTGVAPVPGTLTGTTNEISVTNGAGSITLSIPNTLSIPGKVTSYNGISTVGNGVSSIFATLDLTTQAANVANTTIYAVPSSGVGMYRVTAYIVITQAATTSSTLPQVNVGWNDSDTNTVETIGITGTSTSNTVGTYSLGNVSVYAKASTNLTINTSGYASSGATPMQFALHIKLEYLG